MIEHSVKKPIVHFNNYFGFIDLAKDHGTIDEEEYALKVCSPGPIFNDEAMNVHLFLQSKLLVNQQRCSRWHV